MQYEISNWARDGVLGEGGRSFPQTPRYACRHNLVYWRREPYFGFGAGAHSFDGRRRWWNVKPVPQYIQLVARERAPEGGSEEIAADLARGETMMLGLRLVREGVSVERFRAQFGQDLDEAFGRQLTDLTARGLIERVGDSVRLTPAGRLLGNRVFAEFMP